MNHKIYIFIKYLLIFMK